MDPFTRLAGALNRRGVRFVLIGVAGANYYAPAAGAQFVTRDYDLFLPPEPQNLLAAWQACEDIGLLLFCQEEPLDFPRDLVLAGQVVGRRAVVRCDDGRGFQVDLTLVMASHEFEQVWAKRRRFRVDDVLVPVAPLTAIIASKVAADRPKDRLFLATHEEALKQLLGRKKPPRKRPPARRRDRG